MVEFPIDPAEIRDDPETLRLRIQGLFESYHDSDVDFLAENIQNAIDALEEKFQAAEADLTPTLELDVDFEENVLTVRDNGPGISTEVINKIGRPVNSDKTRGSKRGYKGVGLAYAAWSARKFVFATKRDDDDEIVAGELDGGRAWIEDGDVSRPVIEEQEHESEFLEHHETGTVFEFHLSDDSPVLNFLQRLNDRGVETLLRTKTAIGYVSITDSSLRDYPDWVGEAEVSVQLSDRDSFNVPMGYQFIHDHETDSRTFKLEDRDGLSLEELEDEQGTNKVLYTDIPTSKISNLFLDPDGEVPEEDEDLHQLVNDQGVAAYGAFVDRKQTLKDYSDDLYVPNPGRGRKRQLTNPGIHIATATMPCGERQRVELSYGTGNSNRLYFTFDFEDVSPDEGRKTYSDEVYKICSRVVNYYTGNEFVPNRKFLIQHDRAHGRTESEQEMSVQQAKDSATGKSDLQIDGLGTIKVPTEEQDVVGLFHDLLGAELLKGYDILANHGSQEKYDGIFKYNSDIDDVDSYTSDPLSLSEDSFREDGKIEFPANILEHKYQASSLIDDFESDRKSLDDIKLLICWNQGEEDAFTGASDYRLNEISSSSVDKQFYGSTHFIKPTDSTGKVHVIMLQDVIEELAE